MIYQEWAEDFQGVDTLSLKLGIQLVKDIDGHFVYL